MDGHRATWTPSSARRNCDICVQKKVTSTRYNAQPNGVSDVMSDKLSSRSCHFMPCFHVKYVSLADVQQLHEYEIPSTVVVVCVCVCVFSSHLLFWTSSSLDVPAGVTQEEGHTGFLIHLPSVVRALIFLARRIQPFLSLVDR